MSTGETTAAKLGESASGLKKEGVSLLSVEQERSAAKRTAQVCKWPRITVRQLKQITQLDRGTGRMV